VLPEEPDAIRLGLRVVADMREQDIAAILAAREEGAFASLVEFCGRVPLHRNRIENLVLCGAFDALHEHRRGLLWRLDETVALAMAYRGEGVRREAQGVSDGYDAAAYPLAPSLASLREGGKRRCRLVRGGKRSDDSRAFQCPV